MNDKTAPRPRPVLLAILTLLSLVAAVSSEVAHRWLYYVPGLMEVTEFIGPMLFIMFTIAAYLYSGQRKAMLWLWVLAPLSFRRLAETLLVHLLWTLRGGMV
jgi:hypothetical protein